MLIARGAFPSAGEELIECCREYARIEAARPPQRYSYNRHKPTFTARDVLSAYFDDPLSNPLLQRSNWNSLRPKLYLSIYITERDNLVIEASPTFDTGFRYGNTTHLSSTGDFRRFFIYTAPYQAPSNRILYVPLGRELTCTIANRHPWETGYQPADKHRLERHLCFLIVQAKLHQLSLYFDCFSHRRLVEFGTHHWIDFRDAISPHAGNEEVEIPPGEYFYPDKWASPRVRILATMAGISLDELYEFSTLFLPSVPDADRLCVFSDYLSIGGPYPVKQTDLDELILAADPSYRVRMRLAELAGDAPRFTNEVKKRHHHWYFLTSFCASFGFKDEGDGLEWILTHHPEALKHLGLRGHSLANQLKRWIAKPSSNSSLFPELDRMLADELKSTFQSIKSYERNPLSSLATRLHFESFPDVMTWADVHAPLTAAACRIVEQQQQEQILAAEAAAKERRQQASLRRKEEKAAKAAKAE